MELLRAVAIAVAFIAAGVLMQMYSSKIKFGGDSFRKLTPQQAKTIIASYENQCADALAETANLAIHPPESPLEVSGTIHSKASKVSNINGSGNLFLFTESGVGAVNEISKFKGNIWLCGFHLTSVSGVNGTVTINGGKIDSVTKSEGHIFIMGGATYPMEVSEFKGAIVIKLADGQYEGRSYNH